MIPVFNPSAISASPDSTTALHIAHCAEILCEKIRIIIKKYFFIFIVLNLRDPELPQKMWFSGLIQLAF